ncbi:hypothetical protein K435DRAFT_801578 [Dendrothele bispora CBS 962.96]|uniref:Uncharacterized protein n=1 Tax=Dendrothele bispora (strain CBS 962.96) TaxID=1314807 RepID=A0A4S8LNS7_DENBC|nr:hypothetical protein K435DRAFT_801578 [Dendrothele bispora CBS 962.96]
MVPSLLNDDPSQLRLRNPINGLHSQKFLVTGLLWIVYMTWLRPIARLGVQMMDSGYYDANSFQALLIYNKIKPRPSSPDGKPTADDSIPPANHNYVRITASDMTYDDATPVVGFAKFLTHAGISIGTVDEAMFFQACYHESVIRMMFGGTPRATLTTDNHHIPSDWDLVQIKEHRRRVSVAGLLISERKLPNNYLPPRVAPIQDAGVDISNLSV